MDTSCTWTLLMQGSRTGCPPRSCPPAGVVLLQGLSSVLLQGLRKDRGGGDVPTRPKQRHKDTKTRESWRQNRLEVGATTGTFKLMWTCAYRQISGASGLVKHQQGQQPPDCGVSNGGLLPNEGLLPPGGRTLSPRFTPARTPSPVGK